MRKKQIIYFWCAAKDNWASQISEVVLRKEIPISTIRTIIKNLQSTENVMKLPGRESVSISSFCTVRRSVWVARLSKDHSWRIAENCWVSGSENLKKIVKQHLHHYMLFGRVSRKNMLAHPKTNPDTPVMSCFHVSARGFDDCARAVRSPVCVPCFVLERGVRIPALMSWDSVFVSGFRHSRSIFCHCVSARSRVRSTTRSPVHVCFVVLHAVRVFHWLHAFMLSFLVWTRGLWVFSLAACSCLVLHMAGELFAGHVLVFCVSTWLLS